MIWAKTDAGRAEMQARGLVKERAQRNLLLLIDGHKSEEMLLANVAGIKAEDFTTLEAMGLIEPMAAPARSGGTRSAVVSTPGRVAPATAVLMDAAPATEAGPFDDGHFADALTQVIAKELGPRGFTLSLAVEKARTIQELREVARLAVDQIRDCKGAPAAEAARQSLFGH